MKAFNNPCVKGDAYSLYKHTVYICCAYYELCYLMFAKSRYALFEVIVICTLIAMYKAKSVNHLIDIYWFFGD